MDRSKRLIAIKEIEQVIHRNEALTIIAANVRRLLADRNWTLRELSRKSETSPMILSHLMRESRLPRVDAVSRIAGALSVTVDELLKKAQGVIRRDDVIDAASVNVQQLIQERGWSIRELARKSETDPIMVSKLIRKKALPSVDGMCRIAEALETTVDNLVRKAKSSPHNNRKAHSVKEAAEFLELTEGRVRQLLRSGQLKAEKLSERAWAIERVELERFAAEDRPVGNPKFRKQ